MNRKYGGRASRQRRKTASSGPSAWREFMDRNPDLRFSEFVRTCEANSFIYLGNKEDRLRIENLYKDEPTRSVGL